MPEMQGRGIGTELLRDFIKNDSVSTIITFTRNPSVLRMVRTVSSEVYPLDSDADLQEMAMSMEDATRDPDTGVTYHFDRYGPEGLFDGFDPADRACESPEPLKQRFTGLMSMRNALVVAARVRRGV